MSTPIQLCFVDRSHAAIFTLMSGILFDCDGVLVDSEQWSCGAWIPVLKKHGIDVELADIQVFLGRSDASVLAHYARQTGRSLSDDLIGEKESVYFDLARGALETFPGLIDLLDRLAEQKVPMAVASSGRPHKIRFSLEQVGLLDRFDILCSASEVERGKPAPDLFIHAAQKMSIPPHQCIVIEDSTAGIQAAAAAGMSVLGFCSSLSREQLLAAGAEHVFSHYDELPTLLKKKSSIF